MSSKELFRIFRALPELDRAEILNEAEIHDNRPSILKDEGGDYDEGYQWLDQNSYDLITPLLRRVDPSDEDIIAFIRDGILQIPEGSSSYKTFDVRFSHPSFIYQDAPYDNIPLAELTADALSLTGLMAALIAANRPFGVPMEMPRATVSKGSVQFSLTGPGFLGSGLGLVVASSIGMIPASPVPLAAGAVLSLVGSIDLVLNWWKMVEDGRKTRQDRYVQREEENKKKLEILKLQHELSKSQSDIANIIPRAPSAAIPALTVRMLADAHNLTEVYALHILNRTLPTLAAIQSNVGGRNIIVEDFTSEIQSAPPAVSHSRSADSAPRPARSRNRPTRGSTS